MISSVRILHLVNKIVNFRILVASSRTSLCFKGGKVVGSLPRNFATR